jgi:glyceraldehyde-3-phosphate dehydrogenase (NADP+)
LEAVNAASAAYNNGQGLWPTMKVTGSNKMRGRILLQMKATKDV